MTNVELVQEVYEAIGSGDLPALQKLLGDDLSFTLAGTSQFAGRTVGRDNVLALLGQLSATLGINNVVRGMYEGADGVVVHQTGTAEGYADESLLRFDIKDGRITDAVEFLFDVAAFDRFAATSH
jgi:ketosteroid isomerase-like protein